MTHFETQSHRLDNNEINARKIEKRQAEQILRNSQEFQGLNPKHLESLQNSKCPYSTVEKEQAEREEAVTEPLRIIRAYLPVLLKRLSKIKDPRQPKKCKHKMTMILTYGILCFVFQMSSRREANREMTRPMFLKNLQLYFPEREELPHNDTLKRLLDEIDVSMIEKIHIDLIRDIVRKKKFRRYLIDNCYPIAMDGTQKFVRKEIWSEECLERTIGEEKQYYVYVLEASLAFHNGMTIPLMSELLSYLEGDNAQDCETNAFFRLAARLKKEFPRLPVMILLDGLYPNGPVMNFCIENRWQFMIVLKDKSLSTVWGEFNVLKELEKNNRTTMKWGNRKQSFQWVNGLDYWYGEKEKKRIILHVVVCEEGWQVVNSDGKIIDKTSRHAWISSNPLTWSNVHERCNLGARHRWGIEADILVEKCHGFQYEHCFSYNWNAMKGYHYLMRMGVFFIILAKYSHCLIKKFKTLGLKGFIRFIWETLIAPWLTQEMVFKRLNRNFQLRLI